MATRELQRYVGSATAEQIGVVRLQDDATMASRSLIQATAALGETASTMLKHAEAQYTADLDLDQRKKAVDLRAQHSLDPEGFRKAWETHAEGTMAAVPLPFRQRSQHILKAVGESGYESIVLHTAARTEEAARSSSTAALKVKEAEFMSLARAGTDPAKIAAAKNAYDLQLADMVRLKIIDEKGAQLYRDNTAAKHLLENLGDHAYAAYRRGGWPAAEKVLRQVETDPRYAPVRPSVTPESVRTNLRHRIAEDRAAGERGRNKSTDDLDLATASIANQLPIDVVAAQKQAENAERLGAKSLAKRWNVLAVKGAALEQFSTLPLKEQARALDEKYREMLDPKTRTSESMAEFQMFGKVFQRSQADYSRDEFAASLKTGRDAKPAPVDFRQPDWPDRFIERHGLADKASASEGTLLVPMYTEEKMRAMAYMNGLPPSDKAKFMADMDRAMGPYKDEFWRQMAGNKAQNGERNAALATVARENPSMARDIIDGQQALIDNPHYGYVDNVQARTAGDNFFGTSLKHMPGLRETWANEARALDAQDAKTRQDTKSEPLQAGSRATKGLQRRFGVDELPAWNGVKIIPPADGAKVSEWKATLADIDLGPSLPISAATQAPVTADLIRRKGNLYAVGAGRYRVEIDGAELIGPDRRAFVLDYSTWLNRVNAGRP